MTKKEKQGAWWRVHLGPRKVHAVLGPLRKTLCGITATCTARPGYSREELMNAEHITCLKCLRTLGAQA